MRKESRVIGRNVRRQRLIRRWTQEMLAAEVKLSSDYISRLELGKGNPTLDVLVRLSIVFKREVVDLFTTEEQGQEVAEVPSYEVTGDGWRMTNDQ